MAVSVAAVTENVVSSVFVLWRQALNFERTQTVESGRIKNWRWQTPIFRHPIPRRLLLFLCCCSSTFNDFHQHVYRYNLCVLFTTPWGNENIKWVSLKSSYFFLSVLDYRFSTFRVSFAHAMTPNMFAKCHVFQMFSFEPFHYWKLSWCRLIHVEKRGARVWVKEMCRVVIRFTCWGRRCWPMRRVGRKDRRPLQFWLTSLRRTFCSLIHVDRSKSISTLKITCDRIRTFDCGSNLYESWKIKKETTKLEKFVLLDWE